MKNAKVAQNAKLERKKFIGGPAVLPPAGGLFSPNICSIEKRLCQVSSAAYGQKVFDDE